MKFTYTPEGAEPEVWPFKPNKLMSPEAEAIERVTGMSFGVWREAIFEESMLAIRALLWIMLKRQNPTLSFDDVQFCIDDVSIDLDDDDKAEAKAMLLEKATRGPLTDEEAEQLEQLADIVVGPAEQERAVDHVDQAERGADLTLAGGEPPKAESA